MSAPEEDVRVLGSRITDVEKLRGALGASASTPTGQAIIDLFEHGKIEAWMYRGEPHFMVRDRPGSKTWP